MIGLKTTGLEHIFWAFYTLIFPILCTFSSFQHCGGGGGGFLRKYMFKVDDEWRQGSYDDIGLPANMYEVQYFIDRKELFQIFINFPHLFHMFALC